MKFPNASFLAPKQTTSLLSLIHGDPERNDGRTIEYFDFGKVVRKTVSYGKSLNFRNP